MLYRLMIAITVLGFASRAFPENFSFPHMKPETKQNSSPRPEAPSILDEPNYLGRIYATCYDTKGSLVKGTALQMARVWRADTNFYVELSNVDLYRPKYKYDARNRVFTFSMKDENGNNTRTIKLFLKKPLSIGIPGVVEGEWDNGLNKKKLQCVIDDSNF